MKKHLIAAILCAAALPALAQTVDNPIPLVNGENEFTFQIDPEQAVYYSYTPASDEIVTITSDIRSFYVTVKEKDGAFLKSVYNWFYETSTNNMFMVEKDVEYNVLIEADHDAGYGPGDKMKFNMSTAPGDHTLATFENPLPLGSEWKLLPLYGLNNDAMVYSYAQYTPEKDCTLDIFTDWYPWTIEYALPGENPQWTNIPVLTHASSLGSYIWPVDVSGGQSYIFRIAGSSSTKIWVTETNYEQGSSCERPFAARVGANRLPAKSGKYYYIIEAPTIDKDAPDNNIEIKSSASLSGGGYISLSRACNDPNYDFTVYENFALRTKVISKQTCLIQIFKPQDTAADELFEIKFMSPQPYDDFYTAYAVIPGYQMTTPEYPGTYYYMIEPVGEEGMVLTVESDYQPKNEVSVTLSERSKGYGYVAKGETSLRYTELAPDNYYVLTWTSHDEDCSIPFTVNVKKGAQGETAYWPFEAKIGENEMQAGQLLYYRFKGSDEGWVNIYPEKGCPEPSVNMARDDEYSKRCVVLPIDGGYRVQNAKDREFTFKFRTVPEGAGFRLSETPLGEGECMEKAIPTDGCVELTGGPGVYWYKYEPEQDLKLTITTDLKQEFGQDGLQGLISGYTLYHNSANDYVVPEKDWVNGDIFPLTFSAVAGDTYYLEVVLVKMENNATISFEGRPADPGELPTNPIVIENAGSPTEYDFPRTEWASNSAVWYSLHLYPGVLDLETDGSIKVELYSPDNLENDGIITSSGYLSFDADTGALRYGFGHGNEYYPAAQIENEGDYLLKLRWCDPVHAIFTGSALGEESGVSDIAAGGDNVNVVVSGRRIILSGDTDAEVYRIDGVLVDRVRVHGTASVEMQPGAYIVRIGSRAVKVAIR